MQFFMQVWQAPFNPKDWQFALPVSIFAVLALVIIGVWAAKQLGIVKKNGNGNGDSKPRQPTVGDMSLESLSRQFENIGEHIDDAKDEIVQSIRDLTKAINELTMTLLRGK